MYLKLIPDYACRYIHWKLTGKKVLGVGEASGMFPIDMNTKTYKCNNGRKIQ